MKLLSEGDNRIFLLPIKFLSYPFSIRKKTLFHAFFLRFSRSCVSQFCMVNCLFEKLNFVNSLRRGLSSHFNFLSPFSFLFSPFLQHSNLTNRARYFPQSGRFKWIDRPPLRAYGWDCHSIWHHSGLWYCKQRTTQCHSTRKKLYSSNTRRGKRLLLSFKPRETGYESVYYGINNTRPM